MPQSDAHGDELPPPHVDPETGDLEPSDAPAPSDLPAFDQGEEPAWRQPKIVLQSNTLPDITQPHSFDDTIAAPEWSHSQGLEDHLYDWFGFSPLDHQSPCSNEALNWTRSARLLGTRFMQLKSAITRASGLSSLI